MLWCARTHWIAMSEPVGKRDGDRTPARTFTRAGRTSMAPIPVFYFRPEGIPPARARPCLTAQKIGETRLCRCRHFSARRALPVGRRASHKRGPARRLTFEVIPDGACGFDVMPTLHAFSDQWLAIHGGAEKAFRWGRFEPLGLCPQLFPSAVARLRWQHCCLRQPDVDGDGREWP